MRYTAAAGQIFFGSEPCQPILADSTVAKFKTVTTCKSFQTEMTAVPTEISTENGPKKKR